MKRSSLWVALILAGIICLLLYRCSSGSNLDVTPDARRVIEKAKQQ